MAEPKLYLSDFKEKKTWEFTCPVCGGIEDLYYDPIGDPFVKCYHCGAKISVLIEDKE